MSSIGYYLGVLVTNLNDSLIFCAFALLDSYFDKRHPSQSMQPPASYFRGDSEKVSFRERAHAHVYVGRGSPCICEVDS